MKTTDFINGAKGFIVRADHKSDATPCNIRIIGIVINGKTGDLFAYDPIDEQIYSVEPKDVFYTFEEAKKYTLRFLSKMYHKIEKEKEA